MSHWPPLLQRHHTHKPHSPVYELSNGAEVVAHAECVDVIDRAQAQVQLQGLLPVRPVHLQRDADAATFALLQPSHVGQQAGALFCAAAPQQVHPGVHQRCQGAVIATSSLKGPHHLTCDRSCFYSSMNQNQNLEQNVPLILPFNP